MIYGDRWQLGNEAISADTKVYMDNLPSTGRDYLPLNSYIPKTLPDLDYIGFSFDAIHSYGNLGVYRVINSSRIQDSLTPQKKDTTTEVVGGDGSYYFGSYDRSKVFSIDFAFDNITEQQLREWKRFCNNKNLGELIFDEAPYKVYTAKITNKPILKYIPFEVDGQRVYKGEGQIEFTCYYPYAHTPNKNTKFFKRLWTKLHESAEEPDFAVNGTFLSAYFPETFPTRDEWASSTGMPEEYIPGINPGDLPAHFVLKTLNGVAEDTTLNVGTASITIKQATEYPVHWDSKTGLVYYVDNFGKQRLVPYSGESVATIPLTDTPVYYSPGTVLEYDYWYY